MRRGVVAVVCALACALTLGLVPVGGARADDPAERLRRDVAAALSGSTAGARSVMVAVEGAGTVVDLGSGAQILPASTQKVFTVGAVLARLDPAWRMRTEVRATAEPVEGELVGDLVLVAGGDPSFTAWHLNAMAETVAGRGVRRVVGSVRVDDSRYDRVRHPEGWKPHWVTTQSSPLSAFVVDRNAWRSDPEFVADPARENGERFLEMVRGAGVEVTGEVVVGPPEVDPFHLLAAHDSPTLGDLGRHVLKASDNFVSELMLKELGAATSGEGSTAAGVSAVWEVSEGAGVVRGVATDGSGLSRHDRTSAVQQVRWLQALDPGHAWAAVPAGGKVLDGLPVACVDGTLRTRFCRTPAQGRLAAKTGTLDGIVTLSGYTTTATGRRAWFSFLLQGVSSASRARAAVDAAALAVVQSRV